MNWSFKGQLMGFEWKYIGICVDQATGETATAVKQSRDGSIEHSMRDLFQKLAARNALWIIPKHRLLKVRFFFSHVFSDDISTIWYFFYFRHKSKQTKHYIYKHTYDIISCFITAMLLSKFDDKIYLFTPHECSNSCRLKITIVFQIDFTCPFVILIKLSILT